jgi:hypothetical protein
MDGENGLGGGGEKGGWMGGRGKGGKGEVKMTASGGGSLLIIGEMINPDLGL